jgi:hypothetical protein
MVHSVGADQSRATARTVGPTRIGSGRIWIGGEFMGRDYGCAMFSDGLALFGAPKRDPIGGSVVWSPKYGLQ